MKMATSGVCWTKASYYCCSRTTTTTTPAKILPHYWGSLSHTGKVTNLLLKDLLCRDGKRAIDRSAVCIGHCVVWSLG